MWRMVKVGVFNLRSIALRVMSPARFRCATQLSCQESLSMQYIHSINLPKTGRSDVRDSQRQSTGDGHSWLMRGRLQACWLAIDPVYVEVGLCRSTPPLPVSGRTTIDRRTSRAYSSSIKRAKTKRLLTYQPLHRMAGDRPSMSDSRPRPERSILIINPNTTVAMTDALRPLVDSLEYSTASVTAQSRRDRCTY